MSEQTKFSRWLPWIVVIVVVIGTGFLSAYLGKADFLETPWQLAKTVSGQESISAFSEGEPDLGSYWPSRIQALVGTIFLLIIGPSLWIFSEIQNQKKSETLKKGMAWYAGATITVFGLLTATVGSAIMGIAFQNTWERSAQSAETDLLKRELTRMAFSAYELYHLPGDGGEVPGFMGENGNPIQIADLEKYDDESPYNFALAPVESDSTITIYGVGNKTGTDEEFENADGQMGKIQVAVEVHPTRGKDRFQWSDSNL